MASDVQQAETVIQKEVELKLMMVEGLLSIQSGISTIAISQKLTIFLTPTERATLTQKDGDSSE